MDFRWSGKNSYGEPARVTAQDQADRAVWVQACPIKPLYSGHDVREGAMHYEEVAGVWAARRRVRVKQHAVDHLKETRPRDIVGVQVEVA